MIWLFTNLNIQKSSSYSIFSNWSSIFLDLSEKKTIVIQNHCVTPPYQWSCITKLSFQSLKIVHLPLPWSHYFKNHFFWINGISVLWSNLTKYDRADPISLCDATLAMFHHTHRDHISCINSLQSNLYSTMIHFY